MKWFQWMLAGLLLTSVVVLAGCDEPTANAAVDETEAMVITDYYVVYGRTDDVAEEVRSLLVVGWHPVGPLQGMSCVADPNAYCGQQTMVRLNP